MDNLCHTLTGAAFAEAGLKTHTRFGTAALVIAANLPDVDVFAFLASTPPVALRRGWTHGVLAQALLPLILTGLFVLIDKLRSSDRPKKQTDRPVAAHAVNPGALLMLCYAGVLSHVAMDWLNNYGVRLLMPFSHRWFYGDAVFIVDPWLWLTLGAGVLLARWRRSPRSARVAVGIATAYVVVMVVSARAARADVAAAWTAANGGPPTKLMVGPVPINPLRKTIIVDGGDYYQRGTFAWLPRRLEFNPDRVLKRSELPAVRVAQREPRFRALLIWSRFPYYQVEQVEDGTRVTLADMRFGQGLFTATTTVP
jgi:inner membrane protein